MAGKEVYREWRRRVRVAQRVEPADTVISGARVLNVFTQQLRTADIAISDGIIAGVGQYPEARERIELLGAVVAPSFIDAHVHIESSMLWVPQFARATVPRGTGAVLADPHEIANVAGFAGVKAMRKAAQDLPIRVHWMAPSSVPASPLESPGATFDLDDIKRMLAWPECAGLGEMMNFPALLAGEREIFDKIVAANGLPRDGHSPGLRGSAVQAYAAAGIRSDHESTELDEAHDKLAAGMMLVLRQGSSEKNLLDLLPLVEDATWRRCTFGSDDRDAHDLLHNGHVDDVLRTVIAAGLDPVRALTMASWNAAQYMQEWTIGAIAPGFEADLVVLDDDLRNLTVRETWFAGRCVARDGQYLVEEREAPLDTSLTHSVNIAPVHLSDLQLSWEDGTRAVGLVPDQIVTRTVEIDPPVRDGQVAA
ncbi:MAG TPA: amidohydrolase family protein, partial [Thermomicrobiales bacterium]|nr:amidohydrolase family protein [Thermomicrobiales bacterium]